MTYYIYHIPGKKIGVTRDLEKRVTEQQGYEPHEYEILGRYTNIDAAAEKELYYQRIYGYRVDEIPYNKLKFNKEENNMNINVTEQTTTFPCPVNKLKGQLMDNIGMEWRTSHGNFIINKYSIEWIMKNIQVSKYNDQRSYVYNKAFARFYDNHQTHDTVAESHMREKHSSNGMLTEPEEDCGCGKSALNFEKPKDEWNIFDYIRDWADERDLYHDGDVKTQALKLTEEVGETCRAILKQDRDQVIDGIGDCVVVLTNLAALMDMEIEDCIEAAYDEIKDRTGEMNNGTFKKD